MSDPLFVTAGLGAARRRLATLRTTGKGPEVVWLGGFRSDMRATKAEHLAKWGERTGRAVTRFDYSGHGESEGRFEDATIGGWLEDALAVIAARVEGDPVLVGSSMGGWIALLAARELSSLNRRPAGLVLIAPAPDFTQRLMWANFSEPVKQEILTKGFCLQSSPYASEPYPVTRKLIEDGRDHLILDSAISVGCPIHILHGMADPDVPWQHAMSLVECLAGDDVTVTLIKDGDHRLSRPQDLEKLIEAVEGIA